MPAAEGGRLRHTATMRIRLNGGEAEETARIASALVAGGLHVSAHNTAYDVMLTVGEPAPLRLGALEVDLLRRQVRRGGQVIWLTPGEFDLLAYLGRAGRPVSRMELLRDLWGLRFDPQTNSVAVHVSRLRRKIGRAAIVTVPEGYRIGAPE